MTPTELSDVLHDCLRAAGSDDDLPAREAPVVWGRAGGAQFAHARACLIIRQAAEHGVERTTLRPELLDDPHEHALAELLADAGPAAARARERGSTRPLTRHLDLTAQHFQTWYAATRLTPRAGFPVTDVHRTRLWLAEATRTVLARSLHRLGLGAPERM
jgi:arginyl-tRNA synthetase